MAGMERENGRENHPKNSDVFSTFGPDGMPFRLDGPELNADVQTVVNYEYRLEYTVRVVFHNGDETIEKFFARYDEEAIAMAESAFYLDFEPEGYAEIIAQSWRPLFMYEASVWLGRVERRFGKDIPARHETLWALGYDENDAMNRMHDKFGRARTLDILAIQLDPVFHRSVEGIQNA